ncbi:MAG: gliding motility protein GldL [Bacteroidales bacterium]|nr:gliding motility protein GldL [Bacteroidales bacterium]MBR4638544.1 gliding motility protein GldL [Bacteroidales bacterium]MBR6904337.1 gliding motility protein GldL [Bacteroidales bacterium]
MAKLYGWGASVVIIGALFKILHLPGANIMLILGMGIEAIIFFFSAFEPLHVEYNWALVYPELATGTDIELEESDKKSRREKKQQVKSDSLTPTQALDKMLEEAKIGPELMESLASGMRNLSDNAHKLAGVSDAVVSTDNYTASLQKASESVRNLTLKYDKVAANLETDGGATAAYIESVKRATTAVSQLATAYDQTAKSMAQTSNFKAEMDKLTANISKLSNVYGNMLAAMK